MSGLRWLQLSEEELDEFLGDGGTGVLSFSAGHDEPPFSLPVSYGYLGDTGHFHYRLAVPEDSSKERYLDRPVSFVVHDHTDDAPLLDDEHGPVRPELDADGLHERGADGVLEVEPVGERGGGPEAGRGVGGLGGGREGGPEEEGRGGEESHG